MRGHGFSNTKFTFIILYDAVHFSDGNLIVAQHLFRFAP